MRAIHQEIPAEVGRELHGAQIHVNLSSRSKFAAPRTLWLKPDRVPEWRGDAGDRVRVVGSFEGVSSPLAPAEPFNLLDVGLRREVSFSLQDAHNALVYVIDGGVLVRGDRHEQEAAGGYALALHGGGGRAALEAIHPAHLLMLSGAGIREPIVADGPFIMNERSPIDAAFARYRAGEMGHLSAALGGLSRIRCSLPSFKTSHYTTTAASLGRSTITTGWTRPRTRGIPGVHRPRFASAGSRDVGWRGSGSTTPSDFSASRPSSRPPLETPRKCPVGGKMADKHITI